MAVVIVIDTVEANGKFKGGSEPLLTETSALRSRGHDPCRPCARMVRGDGKSRLVVIVLCSSGTNRHYSMIVARNGFRVERNKGRVDDNIRQCVH